MDTSKIDTSTLLDDAEHRLRGLQWAASKRGSRKAGEVANVTGGMKVGGIVEGYAATFHRKPDSYGDVVKRGAFADTLREWKSKKQPIPLLYGHRTDDPAMNIGRVVEAYEDSFGLHIRGEFDADNPTAQTVRKLAREGRLYQFSFAYAVRGQGAVTLEDGTRANELRKLDLFEVSLVQIPANQYAIVTAVKDARDGKSRRDIIVDSAELDLLREKARAADLLADLALQDLQTTRE